MTLGVPLDGSVGFVWDNEGPPSAPQSVADFLAASDAGQRRRLLRLCHCGARLQQLRVVAGGRLASTCPRQAR